MTEPDRRRAWLLAVGLPEPEARAYLALLEAGPGTAGEVARRASLPRNRVYDALDGLAAKGLADVRLGKVRVYAPRGIAGHLTERRDALRRQEAALAEQRARLRELFGAPPATGAEGGVGGFRAVRGRRDVADAIVRILDAAQSSVSISTTVAAAWRLANHADGADAFPRLLARGVDLNVSAAGPADDRRLAALRATYGAGLRITTGPPGLHRIVVDGREAALVAFRPDDERLYVGEDTMLLTDAPALVRESASLAAVAWAAAKPYA